MFTIIRTVTHCTVGVKFLFHFFRIAACICSSVSTTKFICCTVYIVMMSTVVVVDNWLRELRTWCPALEVLLYYGSQEERRGIRTDLLDGKMDDFQILLTTLAYAIYYIHTPHFNTHLLGKPGLASSTPLISSQFPVILIMGISLDRPKAFHIFVDAVQPDLLLACPLCSSINLH